LQAFTPEFVRAELPRNLHTQAVRHGEVAALEVPAVIVAPADALAFSAPATGDGWTLRIFVVWRRHEPALAGPDCVSVLQGLVEH
jgi:hypothetical protein